MATTRSGIKGRFVTLYARFVDSLGNSVTTDDTPRVEITDADGVLRLMATNVHTSAELDDPGLYRFSYMLPLQGPDGYWTDRWLAKIGGEDVEASLSFLVRDGGVIAEDCEPEFVPDSTSVDFKFSKCEAEGISCLMKILKKRLKNDGTVPVADGAGGFTNQACPIFSDDELICFLINGLSEFNQWPHFTNFNFCDQEITGIFADVVIQGAYLLAVAAQSLIEKGREFSINDNGVTYQPPAVSDILTTQYNAQLGYYKEKLKAIKASLKPSPKGLGTFRVTAVNPNFLRLRHLRERQIL